MPEKRIFAKAGHVCMMCGFKATTKNKYRELQDHLVRRHFQERIKAALPTRRPFMCPDHACHVEGKDWQALMRHYTGKHGVLEAYLKEFLARQVSADESKENIHLPPTNKIGCRRKRYKRHSSGGDHAMAAEDNTEDPPELYADGLQQHQQPPTASAAAAPTGQTILQLDDSVAAEDVPPTHLALVLKRRKINKDGVEEEPEETYAFVDLKYFQPLSANQYVMKSQVLDPSSLLSINGHTIISEQLAAAEHHEQSFNVSCGVGNGGNGGGGSFYQLESCDDGGGQSQQLQPHFYESFPHHQHSQQHQQPFPASSIYIPADALAYDTDQVVPAPHNNSPPPPVIEQVTNEVEVSTTTMVHYEEGSQIVISEHVPNSLEQQQHHAKSLNRGCTKVVVETVKSIPMEVSAASETASYELISQEEVAVGLNGMKEIDFTMF